MATIAPIAPHFGAIVVNRGDLVSVPGRWSSDRLPAVGVAVYVMLQRLENVLHRAIHLLLLLLFIFAKLNTRTEGENGDSVR
jgi:hypothetical protein